MTPLEPLTTLIAEAEVGETSCVHIERLSVQAKLPKCGLTYGTAYQGSIDAATVLAKALLPEDFNVMSDTGGFSYVSQEGSEGQNNWAAQDSNEGRSRLLAVLRAYQAHVTPVEDAAMEPTP